MNGVLQVSAVALGVTAPPVLAGRFARRRLGRRGRRLAAALGLSLCAGLGLLCALQIPPGVPSGQAVDAGLIAGIGLGLVPLGLCCAIGYSLRSAAATLIAWLVASLPLACYGLVVGFLLAARDCPSGAFGCFS